MNWRQYKKKIGYSRKKLLKIFDKNEIYLTKEGAVFYKEQKK